jgi:hypothetical protein
VRRFNLKCGGVSSHPVLPALPEQREGLSQLLIVPYHHRLSAEQTYEVAYGGLVLIEDGMQRVGVME